MSNLNLIGSSIHNFEQCYKCNLYKGSQCKQIVHGFGNLHADIMFVGEAPGFTEDKEGIPFVGKSGKLLRKLIQSELVISDNDVYISNVVRCHPEGNRNPEPNEIEACLPFLKDEIFQIKPKIIIATGTFAAKALLGRKFLKISTDRRKVFQTDLCRAIIPIAHPASIRGSEAEMIQKQQQLILDFTKIKMIYDKIKYDEKPTDDLSSPEATFGGLF